MKITVTQEDIDRGLPRHPELCPVALALARALPGRSISHYCCYAYIDRAHVDMPQHVIAWTAEFGDMQAVAPFEFDLDIPSTSTEAQQPC